ncbi:hypothetical protein DMC30DRAFT_101545 [Rhodotorula diobovata]|uniref:VLRF1 domain-containing protein n=1 Tax=Rhodotorula diobovata TaxID=5288 RepID=A0A5C5G158_9BASI|nr:hypothetical protein DMC30DRAFT_101545 [Rhodotorula diobovata]
MAYKLPHQALYAFQLPRDLVTALHPRQLVIPESHPLHPSNRTLDPAPPPTTTDADADLAHATPQSRGSYTCALTGASFSTLEGLKHHYHTDWYRYNVKLRLQGKKTPVSEQEFNNLVDNLSASISGSDASSASSSASDFAPSDSDDSPDSPAASSHAHSNLSRVLRKTHLARATPGATDADEEADALLLAGPRTALQWFEAPDVAPSTQYGVARAALPLAGARRRALPGTEEGLAVLDELRSLQLPPEGAPSQGADEGERKWTLLMFGGGHFAGMVVQLRPRLVGRGKGKDKERELVVLEKKTFHRYTTRRKQGGAQSANDAGKGKAKSAGAMIRRHNEAALTDEVRELLSSWGDEIRSSELVFLRCSKNNYRTFFGYDDAVLEKGDPRIRGFGFPTKRPTINELVRAFVELTRVKTSHLSAEALAALDASYLSSLTPKPTAPSPSPAPPAKKEPPKPAEPQLSKAQELERDRWTRLVDMVRKGRVDALRAFLDKYGPELESGLGEAAGGGAGGGGGGRGELPGWWDARERDRTPTLLHCASAADQPLVVRFLLSSPASPSSSSSSSSADPTYVSPQGRTAYELAPSRPTRNQFRFAAFADPARCDWVAAARVPSGLDERVEVERERREEERRQRARERDEAREKEEERERARVAEREEEERRVRDAQARTPSLRAGVNRLGGGPPQVMQERQRSGLSEEQKRRVEREERARAAEARLRRLGGSS